VSTVAITGWPADDLNMTTLSSAGQPAVRWGWP
jgi:hypothetical protein